MNSNDPWPAGDWTLRVDTDTELTSGDPVVLRLPNIGSSEDRGDALASMVTAYLRGATGITLGAALYEDRTGVAIINSGAHRFGTLDLTIRPSEEPQQ